MSEENLVAFRTAFARFEREGVPPLDMFDPDVEIINFESFPLTRPYRGHEGVVGWLADMSEPFEEFRFEPVDVLAHDDEHVAFTCRVSGRSKTGGPPFALVFATVWTYHQGKVVKTEGFRTAKEALQAVAAWGGSALDEKQ
jgi:ketosteroid isomerase-like protein